MSLSQAIALFSTMVVLALLPSLSVMTVLARSASLGFRHGAVTSLGIVAGDIVYILLVIYGLSVLADRMASLMVMIQYFGAAYLIWLGLSLWRAKPTVIEIQEASQASLISSFLAGFLLTLGDQKAILFYLSFFPAFIDLSTLSMTDAWLVLAIATVAVGGVKVGYALLADRLSSLLPKRKISRIINLTAGTVMLGAGLGLLLN